MKKALLFLGGLSVILLIIIVIKTMTFTSLQVKTEPVLLQDFGDESATNLSKTVTFPTVTYSIESPIDMIAFTGFNNFLAEAYPLFSLQRI